MLLEHTQELQTTIQGKILCAKVQELGKPHAEIGFKRLELKVRCQLATDVVVLVVMHSVTSILSLRFLLYTPLLPDSLVVPMLFQSQPDSSPHHKHGFWCTLNNFFVT